MGAGTSVGKIDLDLNVNSAGLKSQMNNIGGQAKGMAAGAFSKLGAVIAAAFAVKYIADFAKEAISVASALNEVQNVVDVTFPTMKKQINEFAKSSVESFGLSELMAKRFTGTFGAMLKSMGLSETKAADMSITVAKLAGDFASFYDMNQEDAFDKIRAGIAGETEGLKRIGINLSEVAIAEYARSKGITKSVSSMTQAEKAQLRYELLLKSSNDAQGDFLHTSDSWANQARLMTLRWEEFKAALGKGFIMILKPILMWINDMLEGMTKLADIVSQFIAAFQPKQTEEQKKATDALSEAQKKLAQNTTAAGNAAKRSLASFDQLNVIDDAAFDASAPGDTTTGSGNEDAPVTVSEGIQKFVDNLKTSLGGFFATVREQTAFMVPTFANAFNTIKTIVGGYITIITDLWNKWGKTTWENLVLTFTNIYDTIKLYYEKWILPIVNYFLTTFKELWTNHLQGTLKEVWDFVLKLWNAVMEIYNTILKPAIDFLIKLFAPGVNAAFKAIWDFLSAVFAFIADLFKAFFRVLGGVIDFLMGVFTGDWTRAWNGLKTIFEGFQIQVKAIIHFIITLVSNWFNSIKTNIDAAIATFQVWFARFKEIAQNVWNAVTDIFSKIGTWFEDKFSVVRNAIINAFTGIASIIKGPINAVIDLINKVITEVNKLKIEIPQFLGGGKVGFNIPQIPRLAQGGIVSQPMLAMVGDNTRSPEVVAPLHELNAMIRNASGQGVAEQTAILKLILDVLKSMDISTEVYIGGDRIEDAYTKRLKRKNVRAGRAVNSFA